ncbi:MAG: hypothetical protein LBH43_06150 [Treponema sp.]|jgi:hypothetical protein|nr:hypothetical protein [Treponema sp.]
MKRYVIWDKTSDIYTLGKDPNGKQHWTAQEYIAEQAPWAASPAIKVIVGGGAINGTVFMEFEATVDFYKKQGADITGGMTDRDILDAIEYFEDNPPTPPPSPEERMAAALEFKNLLNM